MSRKRFAEFTSRPLCLLALFCLLPMMLIVYGMQGSARPALGAKAFWKDFFMSLPAEGETVLVEGRVQSMQPKEGFGTPYLEVCLENVVCKLPLQPEPYIGEKIQVQGKVKYFPSATNPGEFDLREVNQINHLAYTLVDARIKARSGQYSQLKQKAYEKRKELEQILASSFDAETAGILKAMLLGDKTSLSADTKKQYRDSGIIHVLAISGLHISIIGMAFYGLLRKLRVPAWLAGLVSAGLMLFYGELTGMGVSTKRALVMFLLRLLGDVLRRSYDLLSAMALILIWMLFENPLLVKHSGFLLSYGAVLALGLFYPAIRESFPGHKVSKTLVPAAVLFLFQLPILIWFQCAWNPFSMLLNLLVVPLMTLVVLDGMLVLLVGALQVGVLAYHLGLTSPWTLGKILGLPDKWLLMAFDFLSRLGAHRRPILGKMVVGRGEFWQLLLFYLAFLLLVFFFRRLPRNATPMVILAMLSILLIRPLGITDFTMLDVGQGDGMLLRTPAGHTYLIDGGSSSKSKVGEKVILPALQYMGDVSLEGIFLSHPDEDHISGALELLELSKTGEVEIQCLILSDVGNNQEKGSHSGALMPADSPWAEVLQKAHEAGVPVRYVSAGQILQEKGISILCLGPEKGLMTEEANEVSEVFLLQTRKLEILLTGDTVGAAEQAAIERLYGCMDRESGKKGLWHGHRKGPYRVLKVAHHGSKYSTPEELLYRWKPDVALISCGRKNRYGHPHEELLLRLKKAGITYQRTDEKGAIFVKEWYGIGDSGRTSCYTY